MKEPSSSSSARDFLCSRCVVSDTNSRSHDQRLLHYESSLYISYNFENSEDKSRFMSFQDMKLVPNSNLQSWPAESWYESSRPALSEWLAPEANDLTKQRLAAIGNIVMPKVCHFAMQLLGHAANS